ncbi:MAG: UDPGP type 1 family protein [Lentisphaerales bacterium]|nr:UDPGP type 1 family protein [Lentisphaerales bacterium]
MSQYFKHLEPVKSPVLQMQLDELDLNELQQAIQQCIIDKGALAIPESYEPADYFPLKPENNEQEKLYTKAFEAGINAIQDGKVAAFTVAGGQGTRLGYNGPKGTLPVSPVKNKSLFQIFAEKILGYSEKYNVTIPWYIMCSPLNIEATTAFFKENQYFGFDESDVKFFAQGVMPATDFEGKLLKSSEDSLAFSPNGHGGSLKALIDSGSIADMKERGIEHLSYFQVDNPLISIINPLFIGLHILKNSDMSSRSLTKTGPFEKLGNFIITEGKMTIIEYSDLPDDKAQETDQNGRLRYRAGSPAIHVIRRDFIEKFANDSLSLPYHRAEKKVPYIDAIGELIKPETPNAVKFETFIFDALPLANNPIILEADRAEEFSPVKNKTGVDSLESSQKDQIAKAKAWLKTAGQEIPESETVEISSKFTSIEDLRGITLSIEKTDDAIYIDLK